MNSSLEKQLAEARALFYSWRLAEAYTKLRRFFDRLPFEPTPQHAEYMAMFVRTIVELGKERELEFYRSILEDLCPQKQDVNLYYALGLLYRFSWPPKWALAEKMLEQALKLKPSPALQVRIKILLIQCQLEKEDLFAARSLWESISRPGDTQLDGMVAIWDATLCYKEKKYEIALAKCGELLQKESIVGNWHSRLAVQLVQLDTLADMGQGAIAEQGLKRIEKDFEKYRFRSVAVQLKHARERIAKAKQLAVGRDKVPASERNTQHEHSQ